MKYIYTIIFVSLLSSCSRPPLENCADSVAFKYHGNVRDIIYDDGELEEIFQQGREKHKDKMSHAPSVWDVAESFFRRPLKDKLSNQGYERIFRQCEDKRKEYPQTFDIQWD